MIGKVRMDRIDWRNLQPRNEEAVLLSNESMAFDWAAMIEREYLQGDASGTVIDRLIPWSNLLKRSGVVHVGIQGGHPGCPLLHVNVDVLPTVNVGHVNTFFAMHGPYIRVLTLTSRHAAASEAMIQAIVCCCTDVRIVEVSDYSPMERIKKVVNGAQCVMCLDQTYHFIWTWTIIFWARSCAKCPAEW